MNIVIFKRCRFKQFFLEYATWMSVVAPRTLTSDDNIIIIIILVIYYYSVIWQHVNDFLISFVLKVYDTKKSFSRLYNVK